jgi:hypothetical protein
MQLFLFATAGRAMSLFRRMGGYVGRSKREQGG